MDYDTKQTLKNIFVDLQRLVEKKFELKALEYQEKGSVLFAAVLSNMMGVVLLLTGLLFVLTAICIGLGYLFGNMMLGFLTLGVSLIVIGGYIYKTSHNRLQKRLQLQITSFIDSSLQTSILGEEKVETMKADIEKAEQKIKEKIKAEPDQSAKTDGEDGQDGHKGDGREAAHSQKRHEMN